MLIAVEGIDGSGKGTQARLLNERLNMQFGLQEYGDGELRSCLLSFPVYHTFFGQRIREYLSGRYGELAEIPPLLVSMLYALNRYENWEELERGLRAVETVVCDRYVASNVAHQAAKVQPREAQLALANEIEHMEYGTLGLPRPSLTIYLDIPVEIAMDRTRERRVEQARKQGRMPQRDLHEDNSDYLSSVRDLYRHLAQAREDWLLVEGLTGRRQKTIDQISVEVYRAVQDRRKQINTA